MEPTVAIDRVDLIKDTVSESYTYGQERLTRVKLRFRIKPIGSSEKKKVEIWQIRIIDLDGEVYPVYHGQNDRLDHMGLLIGGRLGESDIFDTKSFEAKKDFFNAKILLILVDKSNNVVHRYQIQLKNGYADAEHFVGTENPIKEVELCKTINIFSDC